MPLLSILYIFIPIQFQFIYVTSLPTTFILPLPLPSLLLS